MKLVSENCNEVSTIFSFAVFIASFAKCIFLETEIEHLLEILNGLFVHYLKIILSPSRKDNKWLI